MVKTNQLQWEETFTIYYNKWNQQLLFFSDNIDIEHIDHAAYREAYKCSQRTNNMDHIANMTTIATNSIKLIILLLQALWWKFTIGYI